MDTGAITRSDFIKGGAATAVVAAVAGGASVSVAGEAGISESFDYECDIVVVGSGMGGFCAALAAQESGAKVIMVEINKWTGGGTAYCGGVLFMPPAEEYDTFAHYSNEAPNELAHTVSSVHDNIIMNWLPSKTDQAVFLDGVNPMIMLGKTEEGEKAALGCRRFFDAIEQVFADTGGTLLFETAAEHIMTDGTYANRITGLYCTDVDGNPVTIGAKAVILACGGFQSNSEMRQKYFGPDANMAGIMGTPWNNGKGLEMAQEVGAMAQGAFGRYAAAMTCASPARDDEYDIEAFKNVSWDNNEPGSAFWLADQRVDFYPTSAILVNVEGKRYVAEDATAHFVSQMTGRQTYATGIYICDDDGWNAYMESAQPGCERNTRAIFDEVFAQIGGKVYEGDTIEELADNINASGILNHVVDRKNLLETVAEYNAAAEAGDAQLMSIPLTFVDNSYGSAHGDFAPLVKPPFHAWPARPCIYACFGGIAVNTDFQAIDVNRKPIKGLYAAVPCAGGVLNTYYISAVANAAASGYVAGKSAAETIVSQ